MKYKVFVDGQEGTTGLKIHERLAGRTDIELLTIPADKRKDPQTRKSFLNEADIAFLCLPDAAAREAVNLVSSGKTKIIDASTAHRTDPSWVYGIPELDKNQRNLISRSSRVSVPGCHATGFIMAIYPLLKNGIIGNDYPVVCQSISGYSGGGKKLIASYETNAKKSWINSSRPYALALKHKHLPEMQKVTGLLYQPLFAPLVSNFYNGMAVSVPLLPRLFKKKVTPKDIHDLFSKYYEGERFVKVMPMESEGCTSLDEGFLNPMGCNDTNRIDLFIFGHDDQILIVSRLDNLGKGASGAAVQNMNIMFGVDEAAGLKSEV